VLAQRVPVRVLMEILWHSQINLTKNTCRHVISSMQPNAADFVDALLTADP
jgi:hypothetical protein